MWTGFWGRLVLGRDPALGSPGSLPSTACMAWGCHFAPHQGTELWATRGGQTSSNIFFFFKLPPFADQHQSSPTDLHTAETRDLGGCGSWANDLLVIWSCPVLQQWWLYTNLCKPPSSYVVLERAELKQDHSSSTFSQNLLQYLSKESFFFDPECMEGSKLESNHQKWQRCKDSITPLLSLQMFTLPINPVAFSSSAAFKVLSIFSAYYYFCCANK